MRKFDRLQTMDNLRNIRRGHNPREPIALTSNRPVERIWFATPSAEIRWRQILRLKRVKASHNKLSQEKKIKLIVPKHQMNDINQNTKKKITLLSSKKRKISSNDSESLTKKSKSASTEKFYADCLASVVSLGPIPPSRSTLFANMSFIFCYVEECEEERNKKPSYSRSRLIVQLKQGGGKVYESFKLIPTEEYEKTILITNTPSLHPQIILCSNAGIPAYSHQWVINCCQQNKRLDPKHYVITPLTRQLRQSLSASKQQQNIFSMESPF